MIKVLRILLQTLLSWVRVSISPDNTQDELKLDKKHSVLYVMKHRSVSDFVVLDRACRKVGLPVPEVRAPKLQLKDPIGAYMYLTKLGWWQPSREKHAPKPLVKIAATLEKDPNKDLQIVPVTIVWGRNPGHKSKSWFKLLFSDDEHAGTIQKIFIVLAQGRDVVLHFGKPISLRKQLAEGLGADQTARKIRRVISVHMRQQRILTTGPSLYTRNQVAQFILRSKAVRDVMEAEKGKSGDLEKVEAKARKIVYEISAEPKFSVVRFFDILLTWVLHKMFENVEVRNMDKVRDRFEDHEIVFMCSHRSHVDYLLIAYVLFKSAGLAPPHQAAGINLNFWPVGGLLRRAGGFFLRRSFGGNRLYTAIFTEYLNFLITHGYSMNFFPEGGRSRTGRLLKPKTGMISMVVQNYLRDVNKPVLIIPINITYDRVFEVKTYLKELQGAKKEKESAGLLFRARRVLGQNFGSAYISFGSPIDLGTQLDQFVPDWKQSPEVGSRSFPKPAWLPDFVSQLANEIMCSMTSTGVLGAPALVSLAVLATPQRAIPVDDLRVFLKLCIRMLEAAVSPSATASLGEDIAEILHRAEKVGPFRRFHYPGGDVIHLSEYDAILQSYYRNSVIHFFALPSLIAKFFQHNDAMLRNDLETAACSVYPFLAEELFLRGDEERVRIKVKAMINALIENRLLGTESSTEGELLMRPAYDSLESRMLMMAGRVLSPLLDRYGISLALLTRDPEAIIDRKSFESECQMLSQRISILAGGRDPEYYDPKQFHTFVELLRKCKYVDVIDRKEIRLRPSIHNLAKYTTALLNPEILESVKRTMNGPEDIRG